MDFAAATPLDPRVFAAMRPYLVREFANPSGLSSASVRVRKAIDTSRELIAILMGTQPDTILFTSGGTESCNMGIFGVAKRPGHIVTTVVEHHAVLEPIKKLEKEGWEVTYVPVDEYGYVSVDHVSKALRRNTVLVSIMYANNEVGTIQPIADIGREILKWRKANHTPYPYFHTDACQAAGFLDLFVDRLHVDLLSANGSKIYGPKGIGFLYKRRGVPLEPSTYGGGQEMGLRGGTENVAGIVGMAKAMEVARKLRNKEIKKLTDLRDYFEKEIIKKIPDVAINGAMENLLPNSLSVTIHGVEAEALILYLDSYGIVGASGAACASVADEASHVLRACGRTIEEARSTVRFTLGRQTKKEDIAYTMRYLPGIVKELRLVTDTAGR